MRRLGLRQAQALRAWFRPERPGPLTGLHVLQTGHGSVWVDRWPSARAAVVECGANVGFAGEAAAVSVDDLRRVVFGFVEPSPGFEAVLDRAFPEALRWPRVILRHAGTSLVHRSHATAAVRALQASDAAGVAALEGDLGWIGVTWGGAAGLAGSGYAWGAFVESRLVSVACSFFVGERYEDVGVVTSSAHRGRGLATVCANNLCLDIVRRGRLPSWSTSPDNHESLGVAERLGFVLDRHDHLLIVDRQPAA